MLIAPAMRRIAPIECELPPSSALRPHFVEAAYFQDAYREPLSKASAAGVVDLFFCIFGHHPVWMKFALVLRNRVAGWCGLRVADDADLLNGQRRQDYEVGDTIGPWPIYQLSENELIAGRDNRHLDFRLSILREAGERGPTVTVSTVCRVHNGAGKLYLWFVIPFHRWGVKYIIARALRAGRL